MVAYTCTRTCILGAHRGRADLHICRIDYVANMQFISAPSDDSMNDVDYHGLQYLNLDPYCWLDISNT